MAWIELHQSLWTHRKTFMLAAELGVKEIYAAAHLAKLWTWCLDNAPDGDLSKLPNAVVAYGASWDGDHDKFMDALRSSGWIDDDGKIHDWFDYAGRLIAKKEANKERMRKARAKNEKKTCDERAMHVHCTNDERALHVQGLPNLTKPYINTTTTATSEHAEREIRETFPAAYRRVYRRDLTPFQADQLGAYIDQDGFDEAVVVRAIERAAISGGGIKLILHILNDYAAAGAKTLEGAIAFDAEYESRKKRGDPKSGRGKTLDVLDRLEKEFGASDGERSCEVV